MYFKMYVDRARQYRWTLYAANHLKVADSGQGYTTKQSCLHGIGLIRGTTNAPIIDEG